MAFATCSFAQVLSMKTSRPAATRCWRAFHCLRRRATSARSCSLACELFFKAETGMAEKMPDTEIADVDPALLQLSQEFATRDVWLLGDPGLNREVLVGEGEGLFTAHGSRRRATGIRHGSCPADRRGIADCEMRGGLSTTHAPGNRCDDALAQVERTGCCHTGWPPIPARSLNRVFTRTGSVKSSQPEAIML